MELLFESREQILGVEGRLDVVQTTAEVHPEPVLVPSTRFDSFSAYVGTVLRDGGRFRMWYMPVSGERELNRLGLVGYAESEDGVDWKKPKLDHPDHGPGSENLIRGIGSQVFIDPLAPETHRYRSVAYLSRFSPEEPVPEGYYTGHSPDGLHWEADARKPTWRGSDVIQCAYHPEQKAGLATLKRQVRGRSIGRRSFWVARLEGNRWTEARCALVPDDFDDVCAVTRGFDSADYYGFGLLPAGGGTVGLISRFWHILPRTDPAREYGLYGPADIGLVFQPGPGDRWLHPAGRKSFIVHTDAEWMSGGIWEATCALNVGDETRIYFAATHRPHNWHRNSDNRDIPELKARLLEEGGWLRSGFATVPRDRIFGFRSDPEGTLTLDLGVIDEPSELVFNYETGSGGPGGRSRGGSAGGSSAGSIRIGLEEGETLWRKTVPVTGRGIGEAVPLTGSSFCGAACWKGGTVIPASGDRRVKAVIRFTDAALYAYGLRLAEGRTNT